MQLGCDFAQGYFISRPMPASEMLSWVAGWKVDSRWLNPAGA
jgi:EAL domain-containing protein (putative c-di-GMP-specific phosphodiesterase class I)